MGDALLTLLAIGAAPLIAAVGAWVILRDLWRGGNGRDR